MKETLKHILSVENSSREKLEEAKEKAAAIVLEAEKNVSDLMRNSTKKAEAEAEVLLKEVKSEALSEKQKLQQDIDSRWENYKSNKEIITTTADKIIEFILPLKK